PTPDSLYTVGTRAVIKKMARSETGVEVLVQGIERVTLLRVEQSEPYFKARFSPLPFPEDAGTEVEALHRAILDLAARALELSQQTQINIAQLAQQATDPLRLVYLLGSML